MYFLQIYKDGGQFRNHPLNNEKELDLLFQGTIAIGSNVVIPGSTSSTIGSFLLDDSTLEDFSKIYDWIDNIQSDDSSSMGQKSTKMNSTYSSPQPRMQVGIEGVSSQKRVKLSMANCFTLGMKEIAKVLAKNREVATTAPLP